LYDSISILQKLNLLNLSKIYLNDKINIKNEALNIIYWLKEVVDLAID